MSRSAFLKDGARSYEVLSPKTLHLGMPHLGQDGVRHGWLLREACHLHWTAIAREFDVPPSEIRDRDGVRVLPSVVACTVNGDASRFSEDDECQLRLTETPSAENGWRSQSDLTNAAGASLRAEILTVFARRRGASNCDLERANLDDELLGCRTSEAARRSHIIRRVGASDRALAKKDTDPPHRVVTISPELHVNGVGLVYFAVIHDEILQAETNSVPNLLKAWPMRNRRIHYFGNLDPGDRMEITARAAAQAIGAAAAVCVSTHIRRASDGAVIATAQSIYGH
ncbi:MAG: hypothetical protein AAGF94_02895 [Pseudomonadota bacterium]